MIFKQFGVGLAAAILIDATIVRAILLPATMKLLGDWNWYLPKWLEWLPHFEHGGSVEKVDGAAGARTDWLAQTPSSERSHHPMRPLHPTSERRNTDDPPHASRNDPRLPRHSRPRRSVRAGQADGHDRQPGIRPAERPRRARRCRRPRRDPVRSGRKSHHAASRPDWATSLGRRPCDRTTTSRSRA